MRFCNCSVHLANCADWQIIRKTNIIVSRMTWQTRTIPKRLFQVYFSIALQGVDAKPKLHDFSCILCCNYLQCFDTLCRFIARQLWSKEFFSGLEGYWGDYCFGTAKVQLIEHTWIVNLSETCYIDTVVFTYNDLRTRVT